MKSTLEAATSADGTRIAFERSGNGPAVILIGGAFNDRSTVAGVAATLAPRFTAVAYDRRGRGDSGDNTSNDDKAREREIDDLAAVIDCLGGGVSVFGHSSGGALALEAAATRPELGIRKLVVYEPAYVPADIGARLKPDLADRMRALVKQGRRDDAVALFQIEVIGLPPQMVEGMRGSDMWGWLTGLAHTLPYDLALYGPDHTVPSDRFARIGVPTLVIAGGASPDWMRVSTQSVAAAIPGGRYLELEGQDHGVLNQPDALRTVLTDFLA